LTDHLAGKSGSDISAELSLFTVIFPNEMHARRLVEVFSSNLADLEHDPEEDLFRTSCARQGVRCRVPNIASSDIGGTVRGEADAVCKFAAPT
jgi:hypothetical protein